MFLYQGTGVLTHSQWMFNVQHLLWVDVIAVDCLFSELQQCDCGTGKTGPCWAYVEPKFGNLAYLADFRCLKQKNITWKNNEKHRILALAPPKLKLNSDCNYFRLMRAGGFRCGFAAASRPASSAPSLCQVRRGPSIPPFWSILGVQARSKRNKNT